MVKLIIMIIVFEFLFIIIIVSIQKRSLQDASPKPCQYDAFRALIAFDINYNLTPLAPEIKDLDKVPEDSKWDTKLYKTKHNQINLYLSCQLHYLDKLSIDMILDLYTRDFASRQEFKALSDIMAIIIIILCLPRCKSGNRGAIASFDLEKWRWRSQSFGI